MKFFSIFSIVVLVATLLIVANSVDAAAPDLVVSSVALSGPVVSGQSATVIYTVINQGTGPVSNNVCWYDRVYLCTNATLSSSAEYIYWNPCGPVAAGASYTNSYTFTLPTLQPGTHYLIAVTDTGDSIPGENYANNTNAPVAFTVTAPDLVVTNVAVLSPTVSGQNFTLAYTVANQGTGPADGCWYDRLYLCTNTMLSSGIYWWQWNPCGPVAAGGTYGYTNTETLPSLKAGTYYWIAITDTGDSIPGENYANNTNAPVAFTVTAPDLVVTNVAVLSPAVSGQNFTLAYTVANQGTGPADGCWYDRLYLCTNTTLSSGIYWWQWNPCGPVAAGGTYGYTNTETLPSLQPGTYYWIAITDTGDSIPGENYANNTNTPVAFTVTAPDLVVTNVAVLSPTVSGQFFTMTYAETNQGNAQVSGSWVDGVYLSTNASLNAVIASWSKNWSGTLAAGTSFNPTNTFLLPVLQTGTYYLFVVTDTGHSLPEGNFNNNTSAPVAVSVMVPPQSTTLIDNYANDSGLNPALWTTQSSLLNSIAAYGEGGFYGNTLVSPILSFGPNGMQMSGANANLEFAGIQSLMAISPPFTLNTTVTGTIANANPFELFLSNNNFTQWLGIFGNINSANCGYYGIWINSVGGDLLYGAPAVGVPYTIQISVDVTGYLTISLTSNGTTLAQQSGTGFTGPFYVILGQGEGTDLCSPGTTNVAVWQYVNVTPTVGLTLSNVRASQRTGTNLVDIYYDLSGAYAPVFVSALVSTNGGTNYNFQPENLSGDGATTAVASGLNHHLVWNAGVDYPNFLSSTMRIQLSVPSGGSFAQAVSPIFTLNTLATVTGGLTGTVLATNGSPVTNAQVGLDKTSFTTSTLSDGTFTLSNIPVGNGCVLDVSAAGYAPKHLTSVNVAVGSTNVGDIILTNVSGPISLKPLVPDVNPGVTTVEQGGTTYRYYQVLETSEVTNSVPLGSIPVSVNIQGGSVIPQTNDISIFWPGEVAGVSFWDGSGIVCVCIPASVLNANGSVQTVQLSIGGQFQTNFQAQVIPRQYDQVWRQKSGGSIGIGAVISAGEETSAESDLRHRMTNGIVASESISRLRTDDGTLGVGAGIDNGGSLSVSSVNYQYSSGGIEAAAQANAFFGTGLRSTFNFDPSTTDSGQNAMKLYVDLGNVLSGDPGLENSVYTFIEKNIEPFYLQTNLCSVEGDVQVGGGYNGDVVFSSPIAGLTPVNFNASASASMEFIFGSEATSGADGQTASIIGASASGSAMVSAGASLGLSGLPIFENSNPNYNWAINNDAELLAKTWTKNGQSSPYKTESIRILRLVPGQAMPVSAWQQYDPPALNSAYGRKFTETLEQTNGSGISSYKWSVYAEQQEFDVSGDLTLGIGKDLGLDVSMQEDLYQGAEVINERGAILQRYQFSYWPTESYPPITTNLFPTQSWHSIISQWATNAAVPIGQAVNRAEMTINGCVSNTAVQIKQNGFLGALLNIPKDTLTCGSQLVSSWAPGILSLIPSAIPAGKPIPLGGPVGSAANYFPSDGSSNYVYGIDGVYRFESTNAFNGTATLTIAYNPADVAGLDPTQLQIYQLPDGTNRWQFVGGTVNTASNTVMVTITNLGTYAIAPPLPTGDLQLILSTNALPADGVSQMTVTITNLILNTGNVAAQQWLFTATANGVQILNQDCDTNLPGVQVVSTNGAVTLLLQAPSGGTVAHVSLASVAGDAYGSAEINLIDTTPPATPTNVVVTAGQSRIWVSWLANTEPDLAGYRVYYRAGQNGPPYDGTATIEGSPSPVQVTGTNCLLRGLTLGTNYFVAVSAVDTTGNESPRSPAVKVTTAQAPPTPPTGVAVSFGGDGINVLMWALSEDDGYNDRDVTQYYIWRAILPGGNYMNIAQIAAGIGVYTEPNPAVSSTQSVSYAVSVVTASGSTSAPVVATVIAPSSVVVNTNVVIGPSKLLSNGQFQLTVNGGVSGQSYVLLASTNLVDWTPISGFVDTNPPVTIYDPDAAKYRWRFYRIGPMSVAPAITLSLNSGQLFGSNGINFALYSLPGLNYEIEASTNLVNWTTITNFVSTNSTFYFSDPAAKNFKQRFYRAVMQ